MLKILKVLKQVLTVEPSSKWASRFAAFLLVGTVLCFLWWPRLPQVLEQQRLSFPVGHIPVTENLSILQTDFESFKDDAAYGRFIASPSTRGVVRSQETPLNTRGVSLLLQSLKRQGGEVMWVQAIEPLRMADLDHFFYRAYDAKIDDYGWVTVYGEPSWGILVLFYFLFTMASFLGFLIFWSTLWKPAITGAPNTPVFRGR